MEYITLNNGVKMPVIGFGTFRITDLAVCEEAVLAALKAGYRMIDTAQLYGNEEAVGKAIKKSGIPREEIFVVTKVWFDRYEGDEPRKSFMESLKRLQLDYVDCLMVHWPYGNYYNCYRQLEQLYKEGLIRSIGVSNFDTVRMLDLVKFNEIIPQINQVEAHLFAQREDERKWHEMYGIVVESYGALGQGKRNDMFENPIVLSLARKYNKTPQQIALKYMTQIGIPVIPKSVHEERIIQNFDIFDFKFNDEELAQLKSMDEAAPHGGMAEKPERFEHVCGIKK